MSSKISYAPSGVAGPDHLALAFGHRSPSQQELYIRLANQAIEKTKLRIASFTKHEVSLSSHSNVAGGGGGHVRDEASSSDYTQLFMDCLADLSLRRAMIAQMTQKDALKHGGDPGRTCEGFGVSRLHVAPTNYEIMLGHTYEPWRVRYLDHLISQIKSNKALWLEVGLKEEEFVEIEQEAQGPVEGLSVSLEYNIVPTGSVDSLPLDICPHISTALDISFELETLYATKALAKKKANRERIEVLEKQLCDLDGGIYSVIDPLLKARAETPLEVFKQLAHTFLENPKITMMQRSLIMSPELEKLFKQECDAKEEVLHRSLKQAEIVGCLDTVLVPYHGSLIKKHLAQLADFRAHNPQLYHDMKLAQVVHNMRGTFPDVHDEEGPRCFKKSANNHRTSFLSLKVQSQIDGGTPTLLTRVTTWIDADPALSAEAIFTKMKTHSFVSLFHQDCIDVGHTLSEAGQFFNKAMSWKEADGLDALKTHVGCMMYLLAHNHRDIRGTAATSEWLERAIYCSHGFEMASSSDRMPDLLALTNPDLKSFFAEYMSSFELHKMGE